MTNYEKLREVFSRTIFVLQKNAFHETTAIMVSDEWLNSEYAEQTAERREDDLSLYDALLSIPNIGSRAICDIKAMLAEYGMKLPVKNGVIKHE